MVADQLAWRILPMSLFKHGWVRLDEYIHSLMLDDTWMTE